MDANRSVLLCTVGGSHRPILRAIKSTSPEYICFFCTDRDPETNRPGSINQVTGKGKIIKACADDEKPTLPNIPTQAGLDNNSFAVRTVPADDLDGAYAVMRVATTELAAQFPGARFISDYTGGTKTMTAALVCAALERDDVELQLVAGARANLVQVQDGTEQAMAASVAHLRLDRAMAPYLAAWRRFAYHEAAEGLDGIKIAANSPDRKRLGLARTLSRALAHWDDFNHAGALKLIEPYDRRIAPCYPSMLPALRLLTACEDNPRREPARLFDLWRNAERRAAQGRFDDAVARWYRLIEWTAQWQLRAGLGENTADFPRKLLPPDADASASTDDDKTKIGLRQSWQVIERRLSGAAQAFARAHNPALRDLLDVRNRSILAHGFRPVSAEDWRRVHAFTADRFLPVLRDLACDVGLKHETCQLPTDPPGWVRTAVEGHGSS